jgi:hypothetical protein
MRMLTNLNGRYQTERSNDVFCGGMTRNSSTRPFPQLAPRDVYIRLANSRVLKPVDTQLDVGRLMFLLDP